MQKLPNIEGQKLLRFLCNKKGFVTLRSKGSHAFLRSPDGKRVTIVLHGTLKKGTLASILESVGLERDEFLAEWERYD